MSGTLHCVHRRSVPSQGARGCLETPAQKQDTLMRYFFHVRDMLDENGVELLDMNAVKKEAVQVTAELLGGLRGPHFWSGEPWKLWVTNQANGAGKILLTLVFSAKLSDDSSLARDPALTAMPV